MSNKSRLYGMMTEFDSASALVEAVRKTRDQGFKRWDVHTPFPIHGMDEAMGIKGHAAAVPGAGRGVDRPGSGHPDAVVDERGRLPVHDLGQAAVRHPGQRPDHVRVDGAAERLRLFLRHVGA